MNRSTILLVSLVAAASLLVSTGAFQLSGTDRAPDADIEMQPADGPNGDYAVLNADGEIELLLTGANPAIDGDSINENAVTPIDRVFTITYTGDRYAEVWLTDDAEDVRFFRGDDPADAIEGRPNNVTLEPGETVPVGLLVDTRGEDDVESAESFTINARVAEPEDVSEIESTETPAQSQPIEDEDGDDVDEDDGDGGDGDGRDRQSFQQDGRAGLDVLNATLSESTVAPGENVTVRAVIENPTSTAITADVALYVNANTVTTTEVTIEAGDTREVVFEIAVDRAGTYEVAVWAIAQSTDIGSGSAEAGTLVVETPTSGSQEGGSDTGAPTATETPTGGTDQPVDVIDSGTPEGSGNATNASQLSPGQEATGFGLLPLLGLLVGLIVLIVALGIWR